MEKNLYLVLSKFRSYRSTLDSCQNTAWNGIKIASNTMRFKNAEIL